MTEKCLERVSHFLAALDAAGLAVVPKEATEAMAKAAGFVPCKHCLQSEASKEEHITDNWAVMVAAAAEDAGRA